MRLMDRETDRKVPDRELLTFDCSCGQTLVITTDSVARIALSEAPFASSAGALPKV
jgi:hypothetical protein